MKTDLLIVGGGLAGGLIALALAARRPELHVTLVEGGASIGGNHIWSFFDADVAARERWVVEPLVCHRWAEHEVRFPGQRRVFPGAYNSIESERLDAAVRAALPADRVLTGTAAAAVHAGGATLADGRTIDAPGVIDARGGGDLSALDLGWQKFSGRLLHLAAPHGLARPVIMDATVDQADGYRFVYLLPFAADRLFVEDTYYATDPSLDLPLLDVRIDDYARANGWEIRGVERREAAALPIAMGGDFEALWRSGGGGLPKAGMAAGLFHPMTGYSLPDAVRTAMSVAALDRLDTATLAQALHAHAAEAWAARGFYRLLARMLFRAALPAERWRVLARFYRLRPGLIERFYAGRSTGLDKVRVLAGKPPVPIGRAICVVREHIR